MFFRTVVMAAALLLPLSASARLSFEQLVSLAPNPDIRPTFEADGKTYKSGGIGIIVYDGVNMMDALGPYQVFGRAGLKPFLVSVSKNTSGAYKRTVTTDNGVPITAQRTLANTNNLEVLVVPGGALPTAELAKNTEVLNWIKAIDQNTVYTTSVCTGSWVLGAAGLLKGKRATTNYYRATELLRHFQAMPDPSVRYIFDGRLVTAQGVTAGIDMALAIVKRVFSHDETNGEDFTQAVMIDLQYDPAAPVSGGSREKTEPFIYSGMIMMYDMINLGNIVKQIPIQ